MDRLQHLKRRTWAFIKQEPIQVVELSQTGLPKEGGVYLITLIYDKQELPLHINNCNNLQEELQTIKPVQQLLISTTNLLWLQKLKPEIVSREETINLLDVYSFVRYVIEEDIKEQMAIIVMAATLLKPLYVGN